MQVVSRQDFKAVEPSSTSHNEILPEIDEVALGIHSDDVEIGSIVSRSTRSSQQSCTERYRPGPKRAIQMLFITKRFLTLSLLCCKTTGRALEQGTIWPFIWRAAVVLYMNGHSSTSDLVLTVSIETTWKVAPITWSELGTYFKSGVPWRKCEAWTKCMLTVSQAIFLVNLPSA